MTTTISRSRRPTRTDAPATLPPEGPRSTPAGPGHCRAAAAPTRAAYVPPHLESLGAWSALTLQQSVPIGPGNF